MSDWRSEPPDSAGWWEWKPYKRIAKILRIRVSIAGRGEAFMYHDALCKWLPIWRADGGQWRKVPE